MSGILKQQKLTPTIFNSNTTKVVCTCCSKAVVMSHTHNLGIQAEHSGMLYYFGTDGHVLWICPDCYQSKILPLADELSSILGRSRGVDLELLLNCKSQL